MIKQATYRDGNNTLIITKPYKDNIMISVNGKKITIPENYLDEMIKNADTPCKLFSEILQERKDRGVKLEVIKEDEEPTFFKERVASCD